MLLPGFVIIAGIAVFMARRDYGKRIYRGDAENAEKKFLFRFLRVLCVSAVDIKL